MAKLPTLQPLNPKRPDGTDSVLLAVYAPFGTDRTLSTFPGETVLPIKQQPLVKRLLEVAKRGVNVAASIDLYDDHSWLVEIPAFAPDKMRVCSTWKQDMSAPHSLAGFLQRAQQAFPSSALVLALEGHGAGYLPAVDAARITPESTSRGGGTEAEWRLGAETSAPVDPGTGAPLLGVSVYPALPVDSPEIIPINLPMSTWGLAQALRLAIKAGVRRPAVIHFNNCFNMSLELLHTVAPYADYATGYTNYNFFTAGSTYPKVFGALAAAGSLSRLDLAKAFARENGLALGPQKNHPTIGATIALAAMRRVALAVDTLATALTTALRPANPADRPPIHHQIVTAVKHAQHYDTLPTYELAVPDQLMDLAHFATQLRVAFPAGPIFTAAGTLQSVLAGIKQYGDFDHPLVDEDQTWDFTDPRLGMNALFPDPDLQGLWDWRSPYYLAGKVDPVKPPAQKGVIPFLADRAGGKRAPWVEFIIEYHRGVKFVALNRARPLFFPRFDARFRPTRPHPTKDDTPGTPGTTGNPSGPTGRR